MLLMQNIIIVFMFLISIVAMQAIQLNLLIFLAQIAHKQTPSSKIFWVQLKLNIRR
jgi:hypothetical protein